MNVKVAVIGMGYWGKNLVRNFHKLGVLSVICDVESQRESLVKQQYPDIRFTNNFQSILNDNSIQAVAIATPAVSHFALAKVALEAGKDVFVEKPLALTTEDGEELQTIAVKNQRLLMVGHILRYHPAIVKLKKLIDEGSLGTLRYIYSNRLSFGKIRTEENILWSFAPHDISVILGLIGEFPKRISCTGGAYLSSGVSDVTLSEFSFPGGVHAHIFVSWLHPFKEQRLVVIGSDKMAVFEDTSDEKLMIYPHKVEWKGNLPNAVKAEGEPVEIDDSEPLLNECSQFIECIEQNRKPITDDEEGLSVLKILNHCQESLDNGGQPVYPDKPMKEEKRSFYVHPTAVVDEPAQIGVGSKIWHFSHIMKNAIIGENCVFGQNCNVDSGVTVGNNVKVQNNVSLYTGLHVEDDVFLGPSCVLTNVTNPRSQVTRQSLYEKTVLKRGCSIGANATVLCGITVGRYAFIGAGAVVTADVDDYALMLGIPAKKAGWISRHGLPLKNPDNDGILTCPESKLRYQEDDAGVLKCIDLNEEDALPPSLSTGNKFYDNLVHGERLK